MSARIGCSAMSLRDTARFRAIASFTAESDVPPRSKKWSRRPIWSSRHAEHLRPRGRQAPLGGGARRLGTLVVGGVELARRAR